MHTLVVDLPSCQSGLQVEICSDVEFVPANAASGTADVQSGHHNATHNVHVAPLNADHATETTSTPATANAFNATNAPMIVTQARGATIIARQPQGKRLKVLVL